MLTAGLLTIVLLSCLDHIKIGNFELKSSGIAERLTRETDTTLAQTPIVPHTSATKAKDIVTVDTASQNILIIGDSMLEGINPRLAAYAKENGHTLNSVIWV